MTWILLSKERINLLTLGDHTIHKSHGETEENEVMQVVDLGEKIQEDYLPSLFGHGAICLDIQCLNS